MKITKLTLGFALAAIAVTAGAAQAPQEEPSTKPAMAQEMMNVAMTSAFKGIEVNGGTVSLSYSKGRAILMVSNDFKIPATPAPHWQVVDKKGNTFLLSQFKIAGDKTNRSVVVPEYVHDIAKVQVWCSFAEVVLGQATFEKAVTIKR